MSATTPRLRMFAGPNGSGKSTLKFVLRPDLLGIYLNPDDIELEIRRNGFLDLSAFGVNSTREETLSFFRDSNLLISTNRSAAVDCLAFIGGQLHFGEASVDSYLASVTVSFLRRKLLEKQESFTLETVMSHPSKVELLANAQHRGYRTYLYFIATDDPEINISRVKSRVQKGGHFVPEDKIVERYFRSLDLLSDAIRYTNRAYIFDNSGDSQERTWLAEITESRELELKADQIPIWFKRAVLDKNFQGPAKSLI